MPPTRPGHRPTRVWRVHAVLAKGQLADLGFRDSNHQPCQECSGDISLTGRLRPSTVLAVLVKTPHRTVDNVYEYLSLLKSYRECSKVGQSRTWDKATAA